MKKFLKITIVSILVISIVGIISGTIGYKVITGKAKLNENLLPAIKAELSFLDTDGNAVEGVTNTYISADEITDNLKYSFISLEDKRYYSHNGVDYVRMLGALRTNVKNHEYSQGGSTITQQLIKNTHLTQEKTIQRKLKEIKLARALEKKYTKDEILAMYLNAVYFGNGIYGIKSASISFFNKDIKDLNISECATLVAVLKNPSKYSPLNNIENATERRNLVLKLMAKQGYITEKMRDEAILSEITLDTTALHSNVQSYTASTITEACNILGISQQNLLSSGYTIKTYLNVENQQNIYNIISNSDFYKINEHGVSGEGTGVLIDNKNYSVIAYFSTNKRNIYNFRRQVGSTAKPILVYAPAFEKGLITSATPILDEKTDFNGYIPSNYNDEYLGWIDTRTAIMKSSNVAAIKVFNSLNIDTVYDFANKINIPLSKEDNNSTVALGNIYYGLNFIELLGGYTMLANGGEFSNLTFIKEIFDAEGNTIYKHIPDKSRVMSEDNAYIINNILMDTATGGTARGLNGLNFEVASKTGTIGNEYSNTDAYNISYTALHTLGVWHGNSSGNKNNNLPLSETGGAYTTLSAKYIWKGLYNKYMPPNFAVPKGVIILDIDEYAQYNMQKIVLAHENTPFEYTKTEIFSSQNYPNEISDCFINFGVNDLKTEVHDNILKLGFNAEKYLNYDIFRITDKKIEFMSTINNKSGKTEFIDYTIPYNKYVEYSIKPYFYNQFKYKIEGNIAYTDKIYIEYYFNDNLNKIDNIVPDSDGKDNNDNENLNDLDYFNDID